MPVSTAWQDFHLFPAEALGYPVYTPSSSGLNPGVLTRVLPAQHPLFSWLYATAITGGHGQKPMGYSSGVGPYMRYDRAQMMVTFSTLPYVVSDDATVGVAGEYNRFTEWEYLPNLEIIQKRAGNYTFTPGQGGISGKAFPQAVFTRSPKSTLIAHWRDVHHWAVFGYTIAGTSLVGRFNPKWQKLLGQVNAAVFPDATNVLYQPSEMLLTAIKIVPKEAPVSPGTMGLGYMNVPRIWDVSYHWSVMSPPRNPALPEWAPTIYPLQGGHNLLPSPAQDGYYYFATGGSAAPPAGTVFGNTIYRAGDYTQLFRGYN